MYSELAGRFLTTGPPGKSYCLVLSSYSQWLKGVVISLLMILSLFLHLILLTFDSCFESLLSGTYTFMVVIPS